MKNVNYFGVMQVIIAYLLLHSTTNHCRIWFPPVEKKKELDTNMQDKIIKYTKM